MATQPRERPIVIAHRGASAERPEHTLASYALAIEQGADFIEPDLVMTRDGVPVARHENEISSTTDVAQRPEFADRYTTKTIDGEDVTGWFTEDFTLRELKTLWARERLPQLRPANTAFDGQYRIPTLDEILALAVERGRTVGRRIGVYPETKHPSYFAGLGLPLEGPLLRALAAQGYEGRSAPIFIQSFEVANLKALRSETELPLIQLMSLEGQPYDRRAAGSSLTYRDMATPQGLAEIATYADGIGVQKEMIIPRDPGGQSLSPTALVSQAHAAGLAVHVWTFRPENQFLPAELRRGEATDSYYPARHGKQEVELEQFFKLGVDGVFADQPQTGVKVSNLLFGDVSLDL